MPEVRRLRAGEWRAWRDLRLAALRESPQAFGSTYELESGLSDREWRLRSGRLASAPDRAMLVAEDGGRLVGSAGVFLDLEQEASILFAMWVAPERRGRGLGMALVEAARDLARSLERPVLRLNVVEGNRAAMSLYLRAGFVDTGRRVRMPRDPLADRDRDGAGPGLMRLGSAGPWFLHGPPSLVHQGVVPLA